MMNLFRLKSEENIFFKIQKYCDKRLTRLRLMSFNNVWRLAELRNFVTDFRLR
jgi:hypothetical protein